MVSAKEAVNAAAAYMLEMYAGATGLRVEEIELDDAQGLWIVTMGFWETVPVPPSLNSLAAIALNPKVQRVYKELRIRSSDGQIVSMKIRNLPSAE